MSDNVSLSLRAPLDGVLEVEGVTGDRFAALSEPEIAALPVTMRSRAAKLGDFFDVRGGRSADIRIEGDLSHVHRLAAGMTGGRVHVVGNVGDEAGLAMAGGVVRSGSKVGARGYANMIASTNDAFCPTLRLTTDSALSEGVNSVLEIVLDGLDSPAIVEAMRTGILAACRPGVRAISAGNYGGGLGPYHFHLRKIMDGAS